MASRDTVRDTSKLVTYKIVVRGELSQHFASTFLTESLGSTVRPVLVEPGDHTTTISVEAIDQAHLLAVLERLRDLAVEIERVNPTSESGRNTR